MSPRLAAAPSDSSSTRLRVPSLLQSKWAWQGSHQRASRKIPPALSHVKVDFGPSTTRRSFADWTTQAPNFTGPMARQFARTPSIADAMDYYSTGDDNCQADEVFGQGSFPFGDDVATQLARRQARLRE